MSNLSHTIRSFNRFELKYLTTLRQAEAFKHALGAYLKPDEHGNDAGGYYLTSLYYDSPDYRCFWEKLDGIKVRRKLRLRYYESAGPLGADTPIFAEIKQRVDRVTQKRRAVLPYRAALQLCDEREIPEHAPRDAPVIEEIAGLLWQYNLRPASIVRYKRQAWVGLEYDLGLRVTFDTELSYRATSLALHEPQPGLLLFPTDWAVVEIKVNERVPYWLTEMVAAHDLNLTRMSKYCQSIALAQDFRFQILDFRA